MPSEAERPADEPHAPEANPEPPHALPHEPEAPESASRRSSRPARAEDIEPLLRDGLWFARRADETEEHYPGVDQDSFASVFDDTLEALENAGAPYALIGGLASSGFGRPRATHDIDVFVKPRDADRVLDSLEGHGFRIERTDPRWIYKGWKKHVMVDVIFRSLGGIHLDDEMLAHAVTTTFRGRKGHFVAPEDLIIMKAIAHDESNARHWHDALGIIGGTPLDWAYLERRALRAPRRVLSLLVYAHSIDLAVPNKVIHTLFDHLYRS